MKKNNGVLNAQQAADFLGAHVETVRRLARKGNIPSYKMGKDWRFRREALMDWAEKDHLKRKPPSVLVIDDDEGICKVMKRFLEAESYRVYLASDGAEGLAFLNRESANLILLDLKMPGMNGAAFLCEFRKKHGNLPVIVVTGYPDSHLMVEAMKYGPITLLAKPIDRGQLIQAVKTTLGGQRSA
jgi:excisionase family DNA binding protein